MKLAQLSLCFLFGGASAFETACNLDDCTDLQRPMLVVTVSNGQTGEPVTGSLTLVAYNETARDSVTIQVASSAPSAVLTMFGDEGTYTVEVRHSDYLTWRRNGVRVGLDRCGEAIAVVLQASLTPN